MSGLPERIRSLSPERRALLEMLRREREGDAITPRPPTPWAPPSFAQQRMWFLDRFAPGHPGYHVYAAVRLRGPLDAGALERAVAALWERHETLRTRFTLREGALVTSVAAPPAEPLPVTEVPAGEGEEAVRRLALQEARTPFDLAEGPPLRVRLLRRDTENHLLLLTVHHIAADGWSLSIVVEELAALYGAFATGEPDPLPPLPIRYADYAAWQRETLTDERLAAGLAYWREELAGAPALLDLPTDRPRPAQRSGEGRRREFTLPDEVTRRVRELARREGVTVFMVLLAAFSAVLGRYAGQREVCVGTPVAHREHAETERLVGFFANTLVLRTDVSGGVSGGASFTDLLGRVRRTVLGAFEHQGVPFERLVEELRPERDLSHTPLFQAMLVLQNVPSPAAATPDLTMESYDVHNGTAKFDLTFMFSDEPRLTCWAEYATDLFDEAAVARLTDGFTAFLERAVADPGAPLWRIDLAGDGERPGGAPPGDGGPPHPPAAGRLVHELVDERARKAPGSLALTSGEAGITYREVNERANAFAHRLRDHGAGPETPVGVALDHSPDLVVALLGILKAGAAYVPVDPGHPPERLRRMLLGAGVRLVVTASGPLPGGATDGMVVLAPPGEETAQEPPRVAVTGDSLAYVIHTSGSTGAPKGVMGTHRGMLNRLLWLRDTYGLDESDRVLFKTPVGVDTSIEEIFLPLLCGGSAVVAVPGGHRDPSYLVDVVRAERVTRLRFVPSMLEPFLAEPAVAECTSLRLVLSGGERLPRALERRFLRELDVRLDNVYGPTEASIDVTWWRCRPEDTAPRVPIGHPMAGATLRLLDDRLRPVPVGVPGELYIGGACVTRGYAGQPAITAERFVPDPFATEPGARLYRTGDRARRLPDGGLDYLDRVDNQVQIRGFRIEPAEVEAALAAHPEVRSAVVTGHGPERGPARLVAYLVTGEPRPSPTGILAHLRRGLPEHMVPASLVFLDALPLTANGKVDRRRLPEPGDERPEIGAYAAPVTETEHALAEVWVSVLGVDRVGIDDSFFVLGGDSILSIKVVSRARELGLDLSVRQVVAHQTVRELARAATAAGPAGPASRPFELISPEDRERLPASVRDAYPLSATQAGSLFDTEFAADQALYRQVLGLHLRGRFDRDRLSEVLSGLCARHPLLRTSLDVGGYAEPLQLVHEQVDVPLDVADLRGLPPEEREAWLADWTGRERRREADLAAPPLFLVHVCRLTDDSFQLSLSTSALILDGWSSASLLSELLHGYTAALGGRDTAPEPPASLYRDFVRAEREAIASREQHRYWTERLAGTAGRLPPWQPDGPDDIDDPAVTGQDATPRSEVEVPEDVERGLRDLAARAAVPLKSVLLAAHLKVLGILTGGSRVSTGLVVNGRLEETDGERVLGQFVNVVPQTATLRPGSWADLARWTFEEERSALPHRRYPMARADGGQDAAYRDTAFNFVHFHVYDLLRNTEGLELLGATDANSTAFGLFAEFSVDPRSSRLRLELHRDPSRIGARQLAGMARHYAGVLAAMAAGPERRHETHQALSGPERDRVVREWNDTGHGVAHDDRSLPALFEERVRLDPGGTALLQGAERLTYAQLNDRANRLAAFLLARGVTPEAPVAVCLERSFDLTTAMVAVLKAGAAYLPIDPALPPERRADLLRRTAPAVLVARRDLAPEPGAGRPPVMVLLDGDREAIERCPAENPGLEIHPERLAALITTSGSTGRPKTVALPHRQVHHRLAWSWRAHPFGPGERGCQKTPIGFVDALAEALGPLLAGVPSLLVPQEAVHDPARLVALLARHRVTRILLVPTLLAALLEHGDAPGHGDPLERRLPALRLWTTSGEPLPPRLVELFEERLPGRTLVNVYGSTEAWDATHHELPRDAPPARRVPVGRPLDGARAYLLDATCRPAPVGAVAEVYVGGAGVARGYAGAPGPTAGRFVPSPFGTGERLYRTGDLGRHLPGGEIELLGRADDQVKLGGVRVEPAEIEAVLLRHPGVRQAAVVVTGAADAPALLACVVTRGGEPPAEVARFARERLPAAVALRVVTVDRMPLTPTGKVDRRALAAEAGAGRGASAAPAARREPGDPVEEAIRADWESVLRREDVGVHDDFFQLGGSSVSAMQVLARVRAAWGVALTVRDVFAFPTVSRLARRVTALRAGPRGARRPPAAGAAPEDGRGRPLSFAQRRLWYLHHTDPESAAYHLHAAVRMRGALDTDALERALSEITRRHEALRTTFGADEDGEPAQFVRPHTPLRLERADLSGEPDPDAALSGTVRAAVREPFDLERGPLLRATLVHLGEDHHVAVLSTHHIASDAWSIRVLIRELTALYGAFALGEPSPLPELPVQYADYAAWQRAVLDDDALARLEDHWRRELHGAPPLLDLAPGRPRGASRGRGASETAELPAPLTAAVRGLATGSGVTPFMCLLAAFAVVLHHRTGREDLVVGTDVAGRDEEALEDLMGFFVNQLPLRADLSGDPRFHEVLGRVRGATLSAYDHRELPFERLVSAVSPRRSVGHAPVVQVKLVMHNVPEQRLELPGLRLEPFEASRGTSQVDLNVRVVEDGPVLRLSAEYDTDLLGASVVRLLLEQLRLVLARVTGTPGIRLSGLVAELDADRERRRGAEREKREAASALRLRGARRTPVRATGGAGQAARGNGTNEAEDVS
ncbi:amino acid adenylation domain-containing protein [Streptomyces sp. SBT349]|uniref:amino acid adenylation domain-containing protein n=1 Tax=Streptomyces sp. SBT349 TaxID=1580539 RepID=UPI00066E0BFE|nr:non-ribosomal peptide synthetase [Streptomyces sp. SBT349]